MTTAIGNDVGASASSPMCIDGDQLLGEPLVHSGTQVYNWSDEQLEIITEHRQYIKSMEMFLKDIEITGPDGKKDTEKAYKRYSNSFKQ